MKTSNTPEVIWQNKLSGCTHRLFAFDLDGTAWLPDILVGLNEEFGPIDQATGKKKWLEYDHAYKVAHTMTNGAHLLAEYQDLFAVKSLDEILTWLKANLKLVPNFRQFCAFLRANGITPVAISNGAGQIAEPMLKFLDIEMPVVTNTLVFNGDGTVARLDCLHNEHDAIRKGDLIEHAVQLGYEIVGCAGDSKGDFAMAEATVKHGGIVIAVGNGGLTQWCQEREGKQLSYEGWIQLDDYASAMHKMQQRVGGF